MKQLYDADYIIRQNNEYEELHLYYSPAEIKLRKMIREATEKCNAQDEKLRLQREKLRQARERRVAKPRQKVDEVQGYEMGM